MTTTVLVTAAGSIPGIGIIQALMQHDELPLRIIAADMQPLSAGFYLSDRSHLVPAASEAAYIPTLLRICREEQVQIIFPVIDEELLVCAEQQPVFAKAGVQMVTNSPAAVRMARDKYATYQSCRAQGVAVPETWLPDDLARRGSPPFPLIVKPRDGRGAAHVHRVEDQRALDFYLTRTPRPLIQQYIDGPEYTIDILTNLRGEVISVVPKARLETKAGMQVKGRIVMDPALVRYGAKLASQLALGPRCNIQCIRSGTQLYLLEINPKFPASLPFTVAAGVNGPLLLVKMLLGQEAPSQIDHVRDGLTMLRYWQEIFVPAGEEIPVA